MDWRSAKSVEDGVLMNWSQRATLRVPRLVFAEASRRLCQVARRTGHLGDSGQWHGGSDHLAGRHTTQTGR